MFCTGFAILLTFPSLVFADSGPPNTSADCKGGTATAKFIVLRVNEDDVDRAKTALSAMKGVVLAESVPGEPQLIRVLINDMGITTDRAVQFLRLGGYQADEVSKKESDAALKDIRADTDRIVIYRAASSKPRTKVFPDTIAGRVTKGYLGAFNSGNADTMRTFELKNRSQSALDRRPIDERILEYEELYTTLGTLEVRGVEYEGERDITVEIFATKTGMGIRATFEFEETSEKLDVIQVAPSKFGAALPDAPPDPSVEVTSIAESIEPLRKRFNEHKGRPRFVAILSPT